MMCALLWDAAPCGSCKNQRFGGTCSRLLDTATSVPRLPFLSTLKMASSRSSDKSVVARPTGREIPRNSILQRSPCSLSEVFGWLLDSITVIECTTV
jgi:hypothetical protein